MKDGVGEYGREEPPSTGHGHLFSYFWVPHMGEMPFSHALRGPTLADEWHSILYGRHLDGECRLTTDPFLSRLLALPYPHQGGAETIPGQTHDAAGGQSGLNPGLLRKAGPGELDRAAWRRLQGR